jgi:hypothetical protein
VRETNLQCVLYLNWVRQKAECNSFDLQHIYLEVVERRRKKKKEEKKSFTEYESNNEYKLSEE